MDRKSTDSNIHDIPAEDDIQLHGDPSDDYLEKDTDSGVNLTAEVNLGQTQGR